MHFGAERNRKWVNMCLLMLIAFAMLSLPVSAASVSQIFTSTQQGVTGLYLYDTYKGGIDLLVFGVIFVILVSAALSKTQFDGHQRRFLAIIFGFMLAFAFVRAGFGVFSLGPLFLGVIFFGSVALVGYILFGAGGASGLSLFFRMLGALFVVVGFLLLIAWMKGLGTGSQFSAVNPIRDQDFLRSIFSSPAVVTQEREVRSKMPELYRMGEVRKFPEGYTQDADGNLVKDPPDKPINSDETSDSEDSQVTEQSSNPEESIGLEEAPPENEEPSSQEESVETEPSDPDSSDETSSKQDGGTETGSEESTESSDELITTADALLVRLSSTKKVLESVLLEYSSNNIISQKLLGEAKQDVTDLTIAANLLGYNRYVLSLRKGGEGESEAKSDLQTRVSEDQETLNSIIQKWKNYNTK